MIHLKDTQINIHPIFNQNKQTAGLAPRPTAKQTQDHDKDLAIATE